MDASGSFTGRPNQSLHHRKSVGRLTAEQLSDLRQAFGAVRQIEDERGYNYHAGIHGLPLPTYCTHDNVLFLPWHRAYLYYFELALRDQVPDVSLPWWDWRTPDSEPSQVPPAYAEETIEGEPNLLYSAPTSPAAQRDAERAGEAVQRETFRNPGGPAAPVLPTPLAVEAVLNSPNFLDFSTRLRSIHNWVHVWIGGTTAEVAWAAYDPLFWAHHAMVDRLWRLWQLQNPESNIDRGILRVVLEPFGMTVEDTLDVTALGYEYATSTTQVIVGGS